MHDMAILLPAAGSSSRMRGRDKLLEPVAGVVLLRRQALRALATKARVIVTVPDLDSPRAALLADLDLHLIAVPDARDGMSASLRHGVRALDEDCCALLVVLPDMPDLETEDFQRLFEIFRASADNPILRATSAGGVPGHPVLLPSRVFGEFSSLTGDQGAKSILQRHKQSVIGVALADDRALIDLDTPEAWLQWRKAADL